MDGHRPSLAPSLASIAKGLAGETILAPGASSVRPERI